MFENNDYQFGNFGQNWSTCPTYFHLSHRSVPTFQNQAKLTRIEWIIDHFCLVIHHLYQNSSVLIMYLRRCSKFLFSSMPIYALSDKKNWLFSLSSSISVLCIINAFWDQDRWRLMFLEKIKEAHIFYVSEKTVVNSWKFVCVLAKIVFLVVFGGSLAIDGFFIVFSWLLKYAFMNTAKRIWKNYERL